MWVLAWLLWFAAFLGVAGGWWSFFVSSLWSKAFTHLLVYWGIAAVCATAAVLVMPG